MIRWFSGLVSAASLRLGKKRPPRVSQSTTKKHGIALRRVGHKQKPSPKQGKYCYGLTPIPLLCTGLGLKPETQCPTRGPTCKVTRSLMKKLLFYTMEMHRERKRLSPSHRSLCCSCYSSLSPSRLSLLDHT